ncbi:ribokinase [Parasalinivibrio latis]|uniref:ribokinase n=1 Tax=Parasalinivibrio latis TaxID=2952610 RepID=UPI0030DF80FA
MSMLVVLGSVNADHVLQVPHFPRPGETLQGHSYSIIPGGKGANQAVAAARMEADIAFIACVGNDDFGRSMRKAFCGMGMDTDGVLIDDDKPTGIAMIQVSATGENSICISPEANACLTTERIQPHFAKIRQADTLLMQLESPIDTVIAAAKVASEAGTKVLLNPAPAQPLTDDFLALVDIITPNETEAEVLTGIAVTDDATATKAAQALHGKGIDTVLITLGKQGVWLSEKGNGRRISGFPVTATDTTAAGDTFNGAFVTALQEGKSMEEAVRFGNAAAAISVTRFGAQTSIPSREDVEAFLSDVE